MAPRSQKDVDAILKAFGDAGETVRSLSQHTSGPTTEQILLDGEDMTTDTFAWLQSHGCNFSQISIKDLLGRNFKQIKLPIRDAAEAPKPQRSSELQELFDRHKAVDQDRKSFVNRLRSHSSISSDYFENSVVAKEKELVVAELQHKISRQKFLESGKEEEFATSQVAQKERNEIQSAKKLVEVFKQMSKKIGTSEGSNTDMTQQWWRLFMGSNLGVAVPAGHLETTDQSNLKNKVIDLCDLKDDKESDTIICVITGKSFKRDNTVAAHILPRSYGRAQLELIFGSAVRDDLDTPRNVVVMWEKAEKSFDHHSWCFVPDVEDMTDPIQMKAWHMSKVKNYKIKVLNPKGRFMNESADPNAKPLIRLRDLDGMKVQFRTDHRPRQRFLYLHYCCAMIKKYRNVGGEAQVTADGLGMTWNELYWGTLGKYFKTNMIAGMAEFVGHEYPEELAAIINEMSAGPTRKEDYAHTEDEDENEGEEVVGSSSAAQESLQGVLAKDSHAQEDKAKKDTGVASKFKDKLSRGRANSAPPGL